MSKTLDLTKKVPEESLDIPANKGEVYRDMSPQQVHEDKLRNKTVENIDAARAARRAEIAKQTAVHTSNKVLVKGIQAIRCALNPAIVCQGESCRNYVDNDCLVSLERKKLLNK